MWRAKKRVALERALPMIPTLPSLQALRILEAATRLRSYSAAAKELGLTHGAVSRQMLALEQWAGTPLFERRGPNMEPTLEGLALTARTREGLRILGDAFPTHTRLGGLVVSTTPAFAKHWLLPRLPRLNAEHPGLIRAVEGETALFESSDRKIDVAVRVGAGGWRDVQQERLCSVEVFPIGTPHLAGLVASAEDLLTIPLIETPYHSWRSWLTAAGLEDTARFTPALATSDTVLALEAAINGLGLALVCSRIAAYALASGRLVRAHPTTLGDGSSYYVVWNATSGKRGKIEVLRDWLRRELTNAEAQ